MNNPYCPILTIGFPPPEKGQRDLRRCTDECALFDPETEMCGVLACVEEIREIKSMLYYSGYTEDEEKENYFYDATEQNRV